MLAEYRIRFLPFALLSCFVFIILTIVLAAIMKPDRWVERTRRSDKGRSVGSHGFSTAT